MFRRDRGKYPSDTTAERSPMRSELCLWEHMIVAVCTCMKKLFMKCIVCCSPQAHATFSGGVCIVFLSSSFIRCNNGPVLHRIHLAVVLDISSLWWKWRLEVDVGPEQKVLGCVLQGDQCKKNGWNSLRGKKKKKVQKEVQNNWLFVKCELQWR